MRHITQAGLELIRAFEGYRPTPYKDIAGKLTQGIGHLLLPGEDFGYLDPTEAMALLAKDVQVAERAVLRLIKVPLTDRQFDALVSFTFNLGGGALQRSTLRKKVNREEHEDVPAEFLKWCRAGGKISRGLLRRRKAEAALYQ